MLADTSCDRGGGRDRPGIAFEESLKDRRAPLPVASRPRRHPARRARRGARPAPRDPRWCARRARRRRAPGELREAVDRSRPASRSSTRRVRTRGTSRRRLLHQGRVREVLRGLEPRGRDGGTAPRRRRPGRPGPVVRRPRDHAAAAPGLVGHDAALQGLASIRRRCGASSPSTPAAASTCWPLRTTRGRGAGHAGSVQHLLGLMRTLFPVTIVDTPSYFSDQVLAAIDVADELVLVTASTSRR
jgi:hypothetical protein